MKLLLLICFVCSMWIGRIRGQVFTTQGNEYPSADMKVIKCFCNETLNEFGLSQPLNSTEVLELYQRGDDNGLYNLLVQNGPRPGHRQQDDIRQSAPV
ncbi:hypothetical protein M8J76_016637 [Diaphorina citri]|nr:hypothetical protein M8J76_016637 [Diaphorina citri]